MNKTQSTVREKFLEVDTDWEWAEPLFEEKCKICWLPFGDHPEGEMQDAVPSKRLAHTLELMKFGFRMLDQNPESDDTPEHRRRIDEVLAEGERAIRSIEALIDEMENKPQLLWDDTDG